MRARQKISISRRPSLAVHANCVDELVAAVVGVRVERGVRGLSVGEPGSGSNDEIHVGIKAVVEKAKEDCRRVCRLRRRVFRLLWESNAS